MAEDDLKATLAALNDKKERAFQRKQEIGNQIGEKIRLISDYRKKRNELTGSVRDLKKERDKLNNQITKRISEIKELRPKTKGDVPKDARGRPLRPRALQMQIKKLEEKLETVPMSFDAEQKLTKQVKGFQKQLAEIEGATGMTGELVDKSKEIDELKKQANEFHAKVTVCAKESQDYHEKMLKLSDEIEALKKEEEAAYHEFLKHKEEYVKLSGDVADDRQEERKLRRVEKAKQVAARKKQEEEEQKTLKERAKEAEEKMTSGKKLTTEDLLALQSQKD